jgi:hypothetical protein
MAGEASASDRTGVSGSVRASARLFPSRLFGYTFLGNVKRCSEWLMDAVLAMFGGTVKKRACKGSLQQRMRRDSSE